MEHTVYTKTHMTFYIALIRQTTYSKSTKSYRYQLVKESLRTRQIKRPSMPPNWSTKRFWKIVTKFRWTEAAWPYRKNIKKQQNSNIIWLYTLFSRNLSVNVAKRFLKLIDLHFLKTINPGRLLTETLLKSVIVAQKTCLAL